MRPTVKIETRPGQSSIAYTVTGIDGIEATYFHRETARQAAIDEARKKGADFATFDRQHLGFVMFCRALFTEKILKDEKNMGLLGQYLRDLNSF